jgi:hypothetical protein
MYNEHALLFKLMIREVSVYHWLCQGACCMKLCILLPWLYSYRPDDSLDDDLPASATTSINIYVRGNSVISS